MTLSVRCRPVTPQQPHTANPRRSRSHVRRRHDRERPRVWTNDIGAATAGLLRFASPAEMDELLDLVPDDRLRRALCSHGMANRVVMEAMLRRGKREHLTWLVEQALLHDDPPELLGRLLDLDDPEVNGELLLAEAGLARIPRNLRRQLAHQTSRRDGVTVRPLPAEVRELLMTTGKAPESLDHALLYAAIPAMAQHALWFLGAGADPHGAVHACRTLLDAGHRDQLAAMVEMGRLPAFPWGANETEPSVLAYVQAALTSEEGERRLRELAERVRRPEILRSVAEIADRPACAPRSGEGVPVRTVVDRRHPCIPRVDWDAVLEDEPRRRAAEGPLPRRAARFMAKRTDTPPELLPPLVEDHPELAVFIPDPAPEILAALCAMGPRPGASVVLKVVGNGLVAGTLSAEDVVATVPEELLEVVAGSLWLPAMRGTAEIRALLGLSGDVPLTPLFVDETGDGLTRRLRRPGVPSHWDPELVYGPVVGRSMREYGGVFTADDILAEAGVDELLAPAKGVYPDPRVLLRLAEHVRENLGGRPEAWMVALRLIEDRFSGSLVKLLRTAGAVTSR